MPPYAPDDAGLIRRFIEETRARSPPPKRGSTSARARFIERDPRPVRRCIGGIEDFLREYSLSTREGLALMVLAEALLRVPDAATQDRLIEDKLAGGDWARARRRRARAGSSLASTWALGLSSRIVQPGDTPDGIIAGVVRRLGQPAVRTATRQAMRVLGHHFVLGETIERGAEAGAEPRRSAASATPTTCSARAPARRTTPRATSTPMPHGDRRDRQSRPATTTLPGRPGISVKLSALHPRYEATKRERVLDELVPRVLDLARAAQGATTSTSPSTPRRPTGSSCRSR